MNVCTRVLCIHRHGENVIRNEFLEQVNTFLFVLYHKECFIVRFSEMKMADIKEKKRHALIYFFHLLLTILYIVYICIL